MATCACQGAAGGHVGAPTSGSSSVTSKAERAPPAMSAVAEERVAGGRLNYRFRASRFSNLFYMVDCLAKTAHCARGAFEELARRELGELSDQDQEALRTWRDVRQLYRGRVEKRGEGKSDLPLPHSHRQIERRVRLAAYTAGTSTEYAANAALFIDAVDAARVRDVLDRFSDRFDRYWQRAEPELARLAASFAKAMKAPELVSLVEHVAAFYGSEMPRGTEITFDLILRPPGANSNAEQLAQVSLVEVSPGERPEDRLDVVLHELFHFFFSQVETTKLDAMVKRFASSEDRAAYAGYGALDEGLASAFGNGLVLKTLNSSEFAERSARKGGLYNEEIIDRIAKAAIPRLAEALERGPTLTDPRFADLWLEAVHQAFPSGPPPRALLRPFACAYPPELADAMDAFYRVSAAAQSTSAASLDPKEVGDMFDAHPRWTRVFLVRSRDLPALAKWAPVVSPALFKGVLQASKQQRAFVYTDLPKGEAARYVFVADDVDAMKELFSRFEKMDELRPGASDGVRSPVSTRP
jgi:hypothetical protein